MLVHASGIMCVQATGCELRKETPSHSLLTFTQLIASFCVLNTSASANAWMQLPGTQCKCVLALCMDAGMGRALVSAGHFVHDIP